MEVKDKELKKQREHLSFLEDECKKNNELIFSLQEELSKYKEEPTMDYKEINSKKSVNTMNDEDVNKNGDKENINDEKEISMPLLQFKSRIHKKFFSLQFGKYQLGQKNINATIQNNDLVIRVGGGYVRVDDFLKSLPQDFCQQLFNDVSNTVGLSNELTKNNK